MRVQGYNVTLNNDSLNSIFLVTEVHSQKILLQHSYNIFGSFEQCEVLMGYMLECRIYLCVNPQVYKTKLKSAINTIFPY